MAQMTKQKPAQGSREYWANEKRKLNRTTVGIGAGIVITTAAFAALNGLNASRAIERANNEIVADFARLAPEIAPIITSAKDKKAQAEITAVVRAEAVRAGRVIRSWPAEIQLGVTDSTRVNDVVAVIEKKRGVVETIRFADGRFVKATQRGLRAEF